MWRSAAAELIAQTTPKMPQHELSLAQYIVHRNGLRAGARGSMRNMLHRSFGAPTFSGFWRHWNPILGYALGRYIYRPLRRVMPPSLALFLTFIFSGAVHDAVTMAIRGAPAFLFVPWFALLGLGVLVGRACAWDFTGHVWWVRALVNLVYLALGLTATLVAKHGVS